MTLMGFFSGPFGARRKFDLKRLGNKVPSSCGGGHNQSPPPSGRGWGEGWPRPETDFCLLCAFSLHSTPVVLHKAARGCKQPSTNDSARKFAWATLAGARCTGAFPDIMTGSAQTAPPKSPPLHGCSRHHDPRRSRAQSPQH